MPARESLGIIIILIIMGSLSFAQERSGEYTGEERPGMKSRIFAPGFVSTEAGELNAVFTADGKEFYFSRRGIPGQPSAVMVSKLTGKAWAPPEKVDFTGKYNDIDLFLVPGGRQMVFCSNRPLEPGSQTLKTHNFWISTRENNVWLDPVLFAPAALSDAEDYYPVVTDSGNLYFNSQREGKGTNNIYRSRYVDGKYSEAVKLPGPVNSEFREFDAFVSGDEKLIIFSSERPGGIGGSDIYLSHKRNDGKWSEPGNAGIDINSQSHEYGAMISPDGKYFFYTSHKSGNGEIYWVDIKAIYDPASKN